MDISTIIELLTAAEKYSVSCILHLAILRYDEHSYEYHTINSLIKLLEDNNA